MKIPPFTLIIGLFTCLACTSQNKTAPAEKEGWTMVWNDEFDYTGLPDPAKWSFDTEGNAWDWGNNEAQYYTAERKENVWVSDGVLRITALKEKMGGKEYTSGRIRSMGKGDWLYGRFEARAKLPTGRGVWSAFWMMPTDSEYGGWPRSGEIDIMENVGYDPETIVANAHTQKYNHSIGTDVSGRVRCTDCSDTFHIYALEWEPGELRIYLDDQLYYTYKDEGSGPDAWPFDKRFHLLLNLAIGGNWGGQQGIDDTLFPHVYEIDYVRVYRKE